MWTLQHSTALRSGVRKQGGKTTAGRAQFSDGLLETVVRIDCGLARDAARRGFDFEGRRRLRERESEQTRAQQHEAGCSQSEETVGYQVVITHVTPATLEARPNSLKLSESARLKEVVPAQGQALERKPSNAWARKIPALNRPKHAVIVSIIAKPFAS